MRFNILFVQKFTQNFVDNYFLILYMCSVRPICVFKNLVLYFMAPIRNCPKNIPEGGRKEARYPHLHRQPAHLPFQRGSRDRKDVDSSIAPRQLDR